MRVMLNETSISSVQPNADNELPSTSSGYSLRPNRIRVPPEQLSRSESLESIISTTTIASSNQRIDITTNTSTSLSSNVMTSASSNVVVTTTPATVTTNTISQAGSMLALSPTSSRMTSTTQQNRNPNRNVRDVQAENANLFRDFLRAQVENIQIQKDYMQVQIERANLAIDREKIALETAQRLAEIEIQKSKDLAAIEIEAMKNDMDCN